MEREKLKEVELVLEKIRPALKEHHGNLKVVDIKGVRCIYNLRVMHRLSHSGR
jgi:Fe-S cluster biogenesis protein NfuA